MRARRVLRWYGMRVGILVALVASLLAVPAVSRGEYFGGTPFRMWSIGRIRASNVTSTRWNWQR
jgi:hypothetical protein